MNLRIRYRRTQDPGAAPPPTGVPTSNFEDKFKVCPMEHVFWLFGA